jgi:tRNA U34 5-methylaminomethyl-2-thiouridine-forming methyltransferase MnmC
VTKVTFVSNDIRTTDDGCLTLFHPRFKQTYHSMHGALQEARHVFLQESLVKDRLSDGLRTRILEVGFGLGLNFLMTSHEAKNTSTAIDYVALECNLLDADQLRKMQYADLLNEHSLGDRFYRWREQFPDDMEPGGYEFQDGALIKLKLLIGDALTAKLEGHFDAIYLDAFSPDANPELWTVDFLKKLAGIMAPGACLATYSAKGSVRRALQEAGLDVVKRPGPPGKREMLTAIKRG